MSNKPAAASRTRMYTRLVTGLKSFSSSLSDQSIIDAGVGLFIIIALSFLLLRSYHLPKIEPLPAGAVAAADVIAPEDLKTEDSTETERLRAQTVASIPPVFDYQPKITRDMRKSIEQIFAAGREAGPNAEPGQVREAIRQS